MSSPNETENILLNKLLGLVTNIQWSPEKTVELFNALLNQFQSTKTDRSLLPLWITEILHYIEINNITPTTSCKGGIELIKLIQDKTIEDTNFFKYLANDREKELDEILEEIRQEKLNQIDTNILRKVRDIVSTVNEDLKSQNNQSQQSGLKKDLLRLCQAVEKTHPKIKPRLTQMVSWCIMALSGTGRLIQVGTGEGKSCIVAMFAAFRALRGEKVDVMSSSPVLAERDLEEWRNFYNHLNISVDCNTNKQKSDLKKCYECQVVYGTVEQFAGDWLRQHFRRMDILGQRSFQCAIVDEVDSLMLDKGLHVVYLSSDMPALQHLNPLLALIWATVNQYTKTGTGTTVGPKYNFHQIVFENLKNSKNINRFTIFQIAEDAGILAKGSVNELRRNLSCFSEKNVNITVSQLAEFFKTVKRRFPSCQFDLHRINNDGAIEELNNKTHEENVTEPRVPLLLTDGGFCQYMFYDKETLLRAVEAEIKQSLCFTPCELSDDKSICYIPGFLSDLVETKLKVWIDNAFQAQNMTLDHEYVIEKHGLVPVDYKCTGVVENYMKWSDGLHQFLEMKHMSKLSDMTAITNYMSNVGLLQMYGNQIFGISGTLGQQTETETLQKIYDGIKTCQIPTFKRRKLFEVGGIVVKEEKDWIDRICAVVTAQTNSTTYRKPRAVLVICETIKRAKMIHKALGDKVPNKTLYINNNMDNSAIFKKKLEAGEVIIATNLAGRGTDLKVSNDVNDAGGLFVVQTFLPKNIRVEAQAFGRTARQGSPGCAQLITCSCHLSKTHQLLILTKQLCYLLDNNEDTKPNPGLFVKEWRLYLQKHSTKQCEVMSFTLLDILTKTSKPEIQMAKDVRDDLVTEELASYLECDIPRIKKKQELFNHYLSVLDDVYKSSNDKPSESVLSALNEFWGMWLLTKFTLKKSTIELKSQLSRDLDRATNEIKQRKSPSSNLYHYIAFGNELQEKGQIEDSIKMYTKAIEEDHCWAAIAFYNRAFTALFQQNRYQDRKCIDQALQDLLNAHQSVKLYCDQIEVTYRYYTQQNNEHHSDTVTRFDSHIIARYKVLQFFMNNITEAIMKVQRARELGGNIKVEKSLVFFLVPVIHLLPSVVLSRESVTQIFSRDPLKMYQLISHPSFDIVNELRCLEYLGLTHVYALDTLFSLGGFISKIFRK